MQRMMMPVAKRLLVFGSNYDGLLGPRHSKDKVPENQLVVENNDDEEEEVEEVVSRPTEFKALTVEDIVEIQLGCSHALARTDDGTLFSWGLNEAGALGIGRGKVQNDAPTKLQSLDAMVVKGVSAGFSHTALVAQGQAYTFGNGERGCLGLNERSAKPRRDTVYDTANHYKPSLVRSLQSVRIAQVVCGKEFTVFLSTRGAVYSCGTSQHGCLGLGSPEASPHFSKKFPDVPYPALVESMRLVPVVQIASGESHVLALSSSGHVFAWGRSHKGQTGQSHTTDLWKPSQLKTRTKRVVSIAAGGHSSAYVDVAGALYTFGANNLGQLGCDSTASHYATPARVSLLSHEEVTRISMGNTHALVLTRSGKVFAFGSCSQGELGALISHTHTIPAPTRVASIELSESEAVLDVAAGNATSAILIGARPLSSPSSPSSSALVFPEAFSFAELKRAATMLADENEPHFQHRQFAEHVFKTFSDPAVLNASFVPSASKLASWQRERESSTSGEWKTSSSSSISGAATRSRSSSLTMTRLLDDWKQNHSNNCQFDLIDIDELEESYKIILRASLGDTNNIIRRSLLTAIQTSVGIITSVLEKEPLNNNANLFRCIPILLHCPLLSGGSLSGVEILSELAKAIKRCSVPVVEYFVRDVWGESYQPDLYAARLVTPLVKCIGSRLMQEHKRANGALIAVPADDTKLCIELLGLYHSAPQTEIPAATFYVEELDQCVDCPTVYMQYAHHQAEAMLLQSNHVQKFQLMQFPFVFPVSLKAKMMRMERGLTLEHMIKQQVATMLANSANGQPQQPLIQPYLDVKIDRNDVVKSAWQEFKDKTPWDFVKPLRVHFLNEEGVDFSGLTKEFFQLSLTELREELFRYDAEERMLWFVDTKEPSSSASSTTPPPTTTTTSTTTATSSTTTDGEGWDVESKHSLFGTLLALSAIHNVTAKLRFPRTFWRQMLDLPMSLSDLKHDDFNMYQGLLDLLTYDERNGSIEDVYGLTLIDEEDVPVTRANRQAYAVSLMRYEYHDKVKTRLEAIKHGFRRVLDGFALQLFTPEELELLICGKQALNFNELRETATYEGYTPTTNVVQWFWEIVLSELSFTQQKSLLTFVTGSSTAPMGGLKELRVKLQRAGPDSSVWPTAYTCFNLLLLPEYASKDKLRVKLLAALEHFPHSGFGLQ